MKIPFGQILGPFFKRHHTKINHICKPCLFGSQIYLSAFSITGLMITIFDLVNIFKNGVSPHSVLSSLNPKVNPDFSRNTKLLSIGLNINNYFMLALGVIYRYPVFLMPYLALNFLNIILYMFLVLFATFSKWDSIDKKNYLLLSFMVHNWLQAFCFFRACLHIGDF